MAASTVTLNSGATVQCDMGIDSSRDNAAAIIKQWQERKGTEDNIIVCEGNGAAVNADQISAVSP